MGLGAKLREALNGDKDRKNTNNSQAILEQQPSATCLSNTVPRSYQDSVNKEWYASEPSSVPEVYGTGNSGYTYGRGVTHDLPVAAETPNKNSLWKPAQEPGNTTHHHRKTGSTTQAYGDKDGQRAPYWGDTPKQKKMNGTGVHGGKSRLGLQPADGGHEYTHGRLASVDVGSSVGNRNGLGDVHYLGIGHAGARILHRCENCGVDNDISRYFKKDAVYRMQ